MRQKEIQEYFSRVIETGQISHAYIIEGDASGTSGELGGEFAARLECEKKNHCGTCHSCLAYDRGSHPDIIRVLHEKPDSIGVTEIRRQLVEDIPIKPYSSPYKIYMVEEAEKLTIQAQNALLKTMEEPPWYGIIILLTTNADKLLPTILSRCVLLKVQAEEGYGEDGLEEDTRQMLLSMLHDSIEMSVTRMAEGAKEIKDRKLPVGQVMDFIRTWYRDLLVYKSTGKRELLRIPEELAWYREYAAKQTYAQIDDIFKEIEKAESRIQSNVNYELAIELLWRAMQV